MKARIIEIIDEAKDIRSFRLEPEERMTQKPGQYMYVRLNGELKHHFTISSSPTEGFLQFTTKFREESDYKKMLWHKNVGDAVEVTGPFGEFILDENDTRPRLFLAGGIGVTPFRAMIKYINDKKLGLDVKMLYSVKDGSEVAFKNDWTDSQVKIVETAKEGRVDAQKIQDYCPDYMKSTMWICGPTPMVVAMVNIVEKMGVNKEMIRSEEFTGY